MWFAYPFVVMSEVGHALNPAFAPNAQIFALGSSEMAFGYFLVFVSCGSEFAPTEVHIVIFSHISFL